MKPVLFATLLVPLLAQAYQPDRAYRLTLLHTNDLHGRFWPNEQGEYGLAAQKTLVDQIRREVNKQGGSLIILNAGDINTGVPESDLQNARPDIEAMNAIGYDAMTLGNHEFDNPVQLLGIQEKWAKFPFLAANISYQSNGKPLVQPYTILNRQGLKIAVVGLTTEDTLTAASPEHTQHLHFDLPADAARRTLAELAPLQPDLKIALTHIGYYPNGKHGSNAPGDVSLARSLPPQSFDIIVGGHSHTALCTNPDGSFNSQFKPGDACRPDFQNGSWIMQAGEWGKYLGRADFEFRNGRLKLIDYKLIPVNLKQKITDADGNSRYVPIQPEIKTDKKLHARLKRYQNQGDKMLGIIVGSSNGKLEGDRERVRIERTNLGRLIARAQRQSANADIGIINGGGIRDSIASGNVTYKAILKAQPFGNIVSHIDLNGRELADYLTQISLNTPGSGGFPHFDGVSLVIDHKAGQVRDININGKPLNPAQTYRIALSSYLAAGGDGYPKLTGKPGYVNTGLVDAQVLKAYFEQHSPVDAAAFKPAGKITDIRQPR
ncbi:MAG: bifunctional UDP-sugar hydrolase/5'-nucleotidase UshA [Neisseria sp.]|nr:bifunctional UDP-sugar hydrolase/5'-nucleotidase UshA [Neisseria sp.]